jgi:hypothetical protein
VCSDFLNWLPSHGHGIDREPRRRLRDTGSTDLGEVQILARLPWKPQDSEVLTRRQDREFLGRRPESIHAAGGTPLADMNMQRRFTMRNTLAGLVAIFLGNAISLGCGGGAGRTACPPCATPSPNCPYGLLPGTGACGCGAICAPGPADFDAAASACQWPAALDPVDASTSGQCRAARAYVTCQDSSGAGQGCLSSDPTACPDIPMGTGVTRTCQNQCAANEYGAACGSIGPSTAPFPTPPTGCRTFAPTPAGIVFYCCPCG